MTTIYDSGALIAAERIDRAVWAAHRARLEAGAVPVTTAPVVAQVSRSPRQAQLRRFLRGCDVVPFALAEAHLVGALLAKSSTSDVVDAHVAVIASRARGVVITSDRDDLSVLATHTRPGFGIVAVT